MMEAKIYIETHDIVELKKHEVPVARLHFQAQTNGIEGIENIKKFLRDFDMKMRLAFVKFESGEEIYGEWL